MTVDRPAAVARPAADGPTADRPPAVRIDDLGAPTFSPDARFLLDALAASGAGLELDAERLCERASEQTGLDAWGDPGFRGRLDVLCDALRSEADLAPYGAALTWESLLQLLRNRLLFEDLITRHPEIEQVAIERPIIICGLPRTGTTYLHNLLSADPALRHLPYWESLEPVLPAAESAGDEPPDPDPRRARCQAAVDVVDLCMPLFERMHEMTVDHAHEEIQLLAIDVSGMFLETTSLLPSWRDQYRATDQTPSYRYLKRVLQAMTWLRGGTRWVLIPAIVTVSLFAFVLAWNDLLFAIVFTRTDAMQTLSSGLVSATSSVVGSDNPAPGSWGFGTIFAICIIVAAPVIAVFVLLQNWLVSGLSAGAIKG